jgi:hypothetical protein
MNLCAVQEWSPDEAEFVERRRGGDKLRDLTDGELDVRIPGQGRGRQLLLPPLAGAARRRRGPRPHPRQQSAGHRRAVRPARQRVRRPYRGLVQHGRKGELVARAAHNHSISIHVTMHQCRFCHVSGEGDERIPGKRP